MARKIIPYPCDYKVTASVRHARKAGNVLVILLCVITALLIGAGVFFAVTNDYQALKLLESLQDRYTIVRNPSEEPEKGPDAKASEQPVREPFATPKPAKPSQSPKPNPPQETATPKSSDLVITEPIPKAAPDPDYESKLAKPFDETTVFSGLPDIVDAVYPGIVGILNYQYKTGTRKLQIVGSGSGFIVTSNGYIVTNQHVVEDANLLQVSFEDGTTLDALLVGADVQSDVAVLKIETEEELTPLVLGDSDVIRVGEFVLAIGNPISSEELYGSVTFGIISAKARQINIDGFVNEYIQTDAAVNPGNSGGPLINMNGEVIGVTSAKYITAGYDEYGNSISSEGIGFALPIKNVMQIVDVMIKNGGIPRPGIGVTIKTRSEDEATLTNKPAGVYVYSLTEGGPAEQAGLMVDDVIIAIDGVAKTQDEFVDAIRSKTIGDQITFTILRDGKKMDITVTVGDLNQMH